MKRRRKITETIRTVFSLGIPIFLLATGCAAVNQSGSTPDTGPTVLDSIFIPDKDAPVQKDYLIGPGDILEISVWKDPELSRQVVVLPDGTISFPLLGKISAAGKTVDGLKVEMAERISRYVPEPDLTVILQSVNSMVVYVIGKVNRPGHIALNRNISVLQALAMAGGLNTFADRRNIAIIRKTDDGTLTIPFDYKAVTEENQTADNILLQRGDVVVVK